MLETVDVQSLFTRLQTRYPTSNLVSELVQIHQDSYVVRSLIQVGGVTLATAMAAATSVEEAEDRSRLRALAILGIGVAKAEGQTADRVDASVNSRTEQPRLTFSLENGNLGATVFEPPTFQELPSSLLPPADEIVPSLSTSAVSFELQTASKPASPAELAASLEMLEQSFQDSSETVVADIPSIVEPEPVNDRPLPKPSTRNGKSSKAVTKKIRLQNRPRSRRTSRASRHTTRQRSAGSNPIVPAN